MEANTNETVTQQKKTAQKEPQELLPKILCPPPGLKTPQMLACGGLSGFYGSKNVHRNITAHGSPAENCAVAMIDVITSSVSGCNVSHEKQKKNEHHKVVLKTKMPGHTCEIFGTKRAKKDIPFFFFYPSQQLKAEKWPSVK